MAFNPSGAGAPRPRRTIPAALFAVGLLVVAGAAVAATSVYYELRPATTPGSLHLVDDLGRSVTVPQDPGRVVVLGPSIMDSMFRLGLRSHVVGIDCSPAEFGGLSGDYSSDQIALWSLVPSMCVQAEPLVVEQLLNATPDLVLATTIVSVADVEAIDQVYHIPVLMLQPPTLSGVEVDVTLLGEIFGVAAAAAHLVGVISHGLANATALATNLTDNETPFPTVLVTYSTDSNGYWTYGPGTFGESLIELASASSIAANATLAYPELSGEQVLSVDPQILVYGTGFGLTESSYTTAPFWSSLSAVNDGQVFGLDSNWLTEPDPTMILTGLPQLIAIFHPGGSA